MKNVKETVEVTKDQLLEILKGIDSSQFVNVVTVTEPKMRKTNNPYFGKVFKRTKRNYLVGNDYEKRVQNNEKKEGLEGNFQTEYSRVGEHISKCVLFNESKNTYYFQVETFEEVKPTDTEFFLDDGEIIDQTLLMDFLQFSSSSKKQVQDRKVTVQCPKVDNIKEITIQETKYRVVE